MTDELTADRHLLSPPPGDLAAARDLLEAAGESLSDFREQLRETADPREHLLEIWDWIDDQIRRMRKERKAIMKETGTRGARHPGTGEAAEDVATNVIKEQVEQGDTGASDDAPRASSEEKIERIVESAKQNLVDEDTARQWAEETVTSGRRVLMKSVTRGHNHAFFGIESVNDIIEVWLNNKHPVHEHLIEVLDSETEDQTPEELAARLEKASFTLRMLLLAWARYEDKAPMGRKDDLQDIRMDWGREARNFLRPIES